MSAKQIPGVMLNFLPRRAAAGFLTGLLLWSAAAEAIVFNLANRATPSITIRVGGGGNSRMARPRPALRVICPSFWTRLV